MWLSGKHVDVKLSEMWWYVWYRTCGCQEEEMWQLSTSCGKEWLNGITCGGKIWKDMLAFLWPSG